MTDFTNLAALVAQGQSLLDLVKGGHITKLEADSAAKLGEVDLALAAKIAQANADVVAATAPINGKIPHLKLTRNQELLISTGSIPDNVNVSLGVVVSLVGYIDAVASLRGAGELLLLSGIEADIKQQFADFDIGKDRNYIAGFNIVQIDWDITGLSDDWLFSIDSAKLDSQKFSVAGDFAWASFVKVNSGVLRSGGFTGSSEVGAWRFGSEKTNRSGFGRIDYASIHANSQVGSFLLALPVVVSGALSHPNDIFSNIEMWS
jgi:hypothetical protein